MQRSTMKGINWLCSHEKYQTKVSFLTLLEDFIEQWQEVLQKNKNKKGNKLTWNALLDLSQLEG